MRYNRIIKYKNNNMSLIQTCDHCKKILRRYDNSLNISSFGSLLKHKSGMLNVCDDCMPDFLLLVNDFLNLKPEENVEV